MDLKTQTLRTGSTQENWPESLELWVTSSDIPEVASSTNIMASALSLVEGGGSRAGWETPNTTWALPATTIDRHQRDALSAAFSISILASAASPAGTLPKRPHPFLGAYEKSTFLVSESSADITLLYNPVKMKEGLLSIHLYLAGDKLILRNSLQWETLSDTANGQGRSEKALMLCHRLFLIASAGVAFESDLLPAPPLALIQVLLL